MSVNAASPTSSILVLGAGPVGKAAALSLAAEGVKSLLLDARPEPASSKFESKAIRLAPSTVRVFERFGFAGTVLEEGVTWCSERVSYRDRDLFTRQVAVSSERPFVNLPQWRTDELLLEQVERSNLIDLRWSVELTGLTQDEGGVSVHVRGPEGPRVLRAPYVVACDGAKSTVRDLLGVPFEGHDYPDQFLIVDITADLALPNERRFLFSPAANPGRQVMLMRQRASLWRVDFQVGDEVPTDRHAARRWVRERMPLLLGDTPYEVLWVSSYRFACRRARSPRVGRVFLCGDAAHVMSPFGGRGLNSGVIDVAALAPLLGRAQRGQFEGARLSESLSRWSAHRRAAADHHLAETDAAMRFMLAATPEGRALRDGILERSEADPAERPSVNTGRPFDEPAEIPDFTLEGAP